MPVALSGDLHIGCVAEMERQIEAALALTDDPTFVVDLRKVTFMDSTAIAALIRAYKALQEQGRVLSVVAPSGSAADRLLEISGLNHVFQRTDIEEPARSETHDIFPIAQDAQIEPGTA